MTNTAVKTFNRDFTMGAIDRAFNGTEEVTIKTKVLTSFTGKDGKEIKGTLDVVTMMLQQGIISSFDVEISEQVVKEDGKMSFVYSVKLHGFDPSVESQTKEGKTFRWFNSCYNHMKFLERNKSAK